MIYLLLLLIRPFLFLEQNSNKFSFMNVNTNLNQHTNIFKTRKEKYVFNPSFIYTVQTSPFFKKVTFIIDFNLFQSLLHSIIRFWFLNAFDVQ